MFSSWESDAATTSSPGKQATWCTRWSPISIPGSSSSSRRRSISRTRPSRPNVTARLAERRLARDHTIMAGSVLIIDAEEGFAGQLSAILQDHGLQSEQTGDGKLGMDLAK